MKKILIRDGTIVTERATKKQDILIEGEKIIKIEDRIGLKESDAVIDAKGKLIIPGGIDQHTHIENPLSGFITAPWETESIAAAVGGNTTVIDFAIQPMGESIIRGVAIAKEKASIYSVVDFSFHAAICNFNNSTINDMEELSKQGVNGFKVFLAYKESPLMVDDETLYSVCKKAFELGSLVLVHAENGHLIAKLQKDFVDEGKTTPKYHELSRPSLLEEEATKRAITVAELTGAKMLIVHVSCIGAINEISRAQSLGYKIFGETCPQYLLLDKSYYQLPTLEAAKYVCAPPLRTIEDQEFLWNSIMSSTITSIGSDHVGFNLVGQKDTGLDNFTQIPNGIPGVEHRIPLIYTYGVKTNRININQFVSIVSTNPAKINGIYPRKGDILVGHDADLVIFDPYQEYTISASTQYQDSDYTPYENRKVSGVPETVILRGNIIVEQGEFIGKNPLGRFIPRESFNPSIKI